LVSHMGADGKGAARRCTAIVLGGGFWESPCGSACGNTGLMMGCLWAVEVADVHPGLRIGDVLAHDCSQRRGLLLGRLELPADQRHPKAVQFWTLCTHSLSISICSRKQLANLILQETLWVGDFSQTNSWMWALFSMGENGTQHHLDSRWKDI
jgi:hypothetical protein